MEPRTREICFCSIFRRLGAPIVSTKVLAWLLYFLSGKEKSVTMKHRMISNDEENKMKNTTISFLSDPVWGEPEPNVKAGCP